MQKCLIYSSCNRHVSCLILCDKILQVGSKKANEPFQTRSVRTYTQTYFGSPRMTSVALCSPPTRVKATRKSSGQLSIELRAERLAAEYLRAWGFRDPGIIAALAKKWVHRAIQATSVDGTQPSRQRFYREVMRQAINSMAAHVDDLANRVGASAHDAQSRRGLLATGLRSYIDEFPREMVTGAVPEEIIGELAASSQRVVPPTCHTAMPVQPLESPLKRCLENWREVPVAIWQRVRYALVDSGNVAE